MCLVVFIGSDAEPSIIPWDDARPGFHVSMCTRADADIWTRLGKQYAMWAGSFQGCGCGFSYDADSGVEDVPERRESLRRLRDYVAALVLRGPVVVHVAWDEPLQPIGETRRITRSFFDPDAEGFHLGEAMDDMLLVECD